MPYQASSTQNQFFSKKTAQLGLLPLLFTLASPIAPGLSQLVPSGAEQTIAQVPLGATTLYVNPVLGRDAADSGTVAGAPYRTITYALQQAGPGTVIQLAPGSYTQQTGEVFPLMMKPGVILRGSEGDKGQTTVIIGGGEFISPSFARQSVTILAERDTEIRGLKVTNPRTRGTAIWVESTNPVITNSTFADSLRDGVFVSGTGNPQIIGNIFTNNDGNGISVARSAKGEIRDNIFQDTGFGITIGGNATTVITGNRVIGNVDGIVVSNSAQPVLRNNVIEDNTRDGVVAIASAQPNLGIAGDPGNNTIRNNRRYDIYNATRGVTIAAVGNAVNQQKISGRVDFVAAQVPTPNLPPGQFRDTQGNWAQAYIEALASRQILTGFPDGTFRPNNPVTRVEFAVIVSKAFPKTPARPIANFGDITRQFWGYQAIQTAYRTGFMTGYPNGQFLPSQPIPRVQVLVSLVNGLGLGNAGSEVLARYVDGPQVPGYAIGPVAAATQRRLIVNHPNPRELNPNRPATRAEVAAFVYQALVNAQQAPAIPSPYLVSP
ncbi:MAG: DUF1565 domain-containing protein [Leptolyngbyaceae cyanobacterium bins.59]|nr:DUF1565 domain-containing protein [Leptolyngbyaceae cyanobacterium bins.59]